MRQQNNVSVRGLSITRSRRNILRDELHRGLWSPKTEDYYSFRAVTDSDLQKDWHRRHSCHLLYPEFFPVTQDMCRTSHCISAAINTLLRVHKGWPQNFPGCEGQTLSRPLCILFLAVFSSCCFFPMRELKMLRNSR